MQHPFEVLHAHDSKRDAAVRERARAAAKQRVRDPGEVSRRDFSDLAASAEHFIVDHRLADAINMALCVRAPLLLTGEPGTGKTQVAYHLSWYLDLPLFRYQVRSTSTATDLRYDFDAVGYLRYAQAEDDQLKDRNDFLSKGPLWQAYEAAPSILLVDEIDKAPRDFPNDLLQEFAEHCFERPFEPPSGEDRTIRPRSGIPPLLLCTSNAERRLPDAFLRRCIVHHIEIHRQMLEQIVASRSEMLRGLDKARQDRALDRFLELRGKPGLSRKPATGELLTWLALLAAQEVDLEDLDRPLHTLPAIRALVKVEADLEELKRR